jgi:hypothetical protein
LGLGVPRRIWRAASRTKNLPGSYSRKDCSYIKIWELFYDRMVLRIRRQPTNGLTRVQFPKITFCSKILLFFFFLVLLIAMLLLSAL